MSTVDNAPLIEAIFELRWGAQPNGFLEFSPDDQTLFVGKVSALTHDKGYSLVEPVNNPGVPHTVTHRFRQQVDTWPCYQAGLGIFTVNQVNEGYKSELFKKAINTGLEIFDKSGPEKFKAIKGSLTFILRYQDVFYPDDGMSVQNFISNKLHISAELPEKFLQHEAISDELSSIRCQFNCVTSVPKGEIVVKVSNAIIDGKPGFIAETLVVSNASELENLNIESIMNWVDEAHKLQRHSFKTIIDEEAYS
jgi:uncharacterized protein (TIGR04255 family)